MEDPLAPTCSLFRHWAFWAAMAVGVGLRATGLFQQTLVGDELHAFRFATRVGFPDALFTFHWTANSPPLNAWVRLLMDFELRPAEWMLRLPILVTGVLVLVAVPAYLASKERLGLPAAIATAWLLSLSPQLIFYSRFMRPYMPCVLAAVAAVAMFLEWWNTRRPLAGVLYCCLALLAIWLHLLSAPFVLVPWCFALAEAMFFRDYRLPPKRQIGALLAFQLGLLALLLIPGWESIEMLLRGRREGGPTARTAWEVAVLLAGSPNLLVATLFWCAVLYGGAVFAYRRPQLARYGTLLVLAQWVGVPILSPSFVENRAIYARYLLMTFIPLGAVVGLAVTTSPIRRLRRTWGIAGAGFIAVIFWTGPFSNLQLLTDSLAIRPDQLHFSNQFRPQPYAPPELYSRLAMEPAGPVVEFPALPESRYHNPLADYQAHHGRRVLLSPGHKEMTDRRLGLRTIVAADPNSLQESGAAYVIVHRDWLAELGPKMGYRRGPAVDLQRKAVAEYTRMRRLARHKVRELGQAWGPPDLADETLMIWDLRRVRAAGPGKDVLHGPQST